ncbi:MAG: UDP-N-acetylmuramoyl-L-alanine--D-glutamate ligase, partial [Patescibacteria group bacterium]
VMRHAYHGKKVLVMGLGILGGGVAATKWFLERGALVTVTDLRSRRELASSIQALGKQTRNLRFVLGKHDTRDFRTHDLIVVNPAVPRESPFLKIAQKAGKRIKNDASLFFDEVRNPVVAVTGTRGKTTTAAWIAHFLGVRAGGNSSSDLPLLKLLDRLKPGKPTVVELSSWQLERVVECRRGPDVAVITNLYRDHLNRYRGMADYARAKANIFKQQTRNQKLILNAGNAWAPFFLKQRPRARVYFFSLLPLPAGRDGIFVDRRTIVFRECGRTRRVISPGAYRKLEVWGTHNVENVLVALLAARLAGVPWGVLLRRVRALPQIPLRQEIILRRRNFTVVNDSAGTSPDATIAALERFSNSPATCGRIVLITGGTDKNLSFRKLARTVVRLIPPRNLFLLAGSATAALTRELKRIGYFRTDRARTFGTLPAMLRAIRTKLKTEDRTLKTIVLFSPGAASFEKFRNEFDRGERFTLHSKQFLR